MVKHKQCQTDRATTKRSHPLGFNQVFECQYVDGYRYHQPPTNGAPPGGRISQERLRLRLPVRRTSQKFFSLFSLQVFF